MVMSGAVEKPNSSAPSKTPMATSLPVFAGVTKAKSDHIVIAGHDGGTGASPLKSDIKMK
jgi:myo-inositol-1-phosphate synthase